MAQISFKELSEVKIWDLAFTSELIAIHWSQYYGLIMADSTCYSNKHQHPPMRLVLDHNPLVESYRFRCFKKNCRKEIHLRRGSLFPIFSFTYFNLNQINVCLGPLFISS